MTSGTDTTLTAVHGAVFQGSGLNYKITDFATDATMVERLEDPFFVADPDYRRPGAYRIFVRAAVDAGTVVNMQFHMGRQVGGVVPCAATPANPAMHDLGIITLPNGEPSIPYGYFGSQSMIPGESKLSLYAERVSGGGSMYWDYVMLVPADAEMCTILFGEPYLHHGGAPFDRPVIDAVNNHAYTISPTVVPPAGVPEMADLSPATQREGGLPFLTPNIVNRLVWMNRGANGPWEDISDSQTLRIVYWPRWLLVR